MARRKGAARADGKRRGSSSPPRKASGRVCGIAWQGQVRSGCREWRVARATRRRKAPSTAPACRRRTRVAVGLGCPRRARRRAARSPRAVIPLTGRRQGPGRLGDTVRDSLNWRDLDDEATMCMSVPQFRQTYGRDSSGRASCVAFRFGARERMVGADPWAVTAKRSRGLR
jgi:hypothetical protein